MNFSGDITNLKIIEAGGNGTITAENYINKGYLTGDYSKKTVSGDDSSIDVNKLPKEFMDEIDAELQRKLDNSGQKNAFWHGNDRSLSVAEEVISNFVSNQANLKIGGNLTFNIGNKVLNQEANIFASGDITINAKEINNTREGKNVDIMLTFIRTYSYSGHHHGHGKTFKDHKEASKSYTNYIFR